MPYKSKRQARFMHAAAARGEISKATVKEWDEKTDFSHLPERKAKKKVHHSPTMTRVDCHKLYTVVKV